LASGETTGGINYLNMMEAPDRQLAVIIERLKSAHKSGNKLEILQIYEHARDIDLELATQCLFEEYDKWVDKCNDVLYL
jgi:hypothetical protein